MKNFRKIIFTFLIGFAVPSSHAQTFSYDAVGRLIQVDYADGTSSKYKYDAEGNLKKVKIASAAIVSINAEEGDDHIMRLSVHRTGDLSQVLIAGLYTGGDAANGEDYLPLPASVTIPAHESSVAFSVTLRADRPASAAKKLTVGLTDSNEYNLDEHSSVAIVIPAKKQ